MPSAQTAKLLKLVHTLSALNGLHLSASSSPRFSSASVALQARVTHTAVSKENAASLLAAEVASLMATRITHKRQGSLEEQPVTSIILELEEQYKMNC